MEKIILLGSGGHAKSVVDAIEQAGEYEIVGFLEVPEKQYFSYKGYQVIGTDEDMQLFYDQGVRYAFITIGYMGRPTTREKLYDRLCEVGYTLPMVIDQTASIALDAVVEEGTFIGKRAIVNAAAHVEKMGIINSGAIIEHECIIGAYSHVAVGAVLCGEVLVGRNVFVGANATIIQGKKIGNAAFIGAGSLVKKDISAEERYLGE